MIVTGPSSMEGMQNKIKIGQTKAEGDFAAKLSEATSRQAGDEKLKTACRDMEAVFLNMLLSRMRAAVPQSNLFPDRSKEELMRSMLDSEMTKEMAKAGGIGLADMIYRQLTLSANANNKSQAR